MGKKIQEKVKSFSTLTKEPVEPSKKLCAAVELYRDVDDERPSKLIHCASAEVTTGGVIRIHEKKAHENPMYISPYQYAKVKIVYNAS